MTSTYKTGLDYLALLMTEWSELDWTEIDNNWQDWASMASSRLG